MKLSSYFLMIDQVCNAFNILNTQCPVLNTLTCHIMIMAIEYVNSFNHYIALNGKNSLTHLLDQISPEIENETDLIKHSKYYNYIDFKNVLYNAKSKISMLSLNCQSISAKFDKLNLFLDDANIKHPISVLKTWSHEEM